MPNITIKIEKLANTGEGIGFHEGKTVFVPFCYPGETIMTSLPAAFPADRRAGVPISKKGLIKGKIESIIEAHPKRISKKTPYPGCDWQNLEYSQQLVYKEDILKDCLKYFGKFDLEKLSIKKTPPSPNQWQYRNKITLTSSGQDLGVFTPNTNKIITNLANPLIPNELQELLTKLVQRLKAIKLPLYIPEKDTGDLRQLIIKWNSKFEILIGLVTRKKNCPLKNLLLEELAALSNNNVKIIGIIQNINKDRNVNKLGLKNKLLWGRPYLTETINSLSYNHSLPSFFQTNLEIAKAIQNQIDKWINANPSEILFDLYGGIGFFSLPQVNKFGETIIVEENPESIEMAIMNCNINKTENTKIEQSSVESFLSKNKLFPAAVLLDPPRKGCSINVLQKLITLNPKQIIYISCSPVTLARDLKILTENNDYKIKEIQPFDMFPQTPHLEIATLLEKP